MVDKVAKFMAEIMDFVEDVPETEWRKIPKDIRDLLETDLYDAAEKIKRATRLFEQEMRDAS